MWHALNRRIFNGIDCGNPQHVPQKQHAWLQASSRSNVLKCSLWPTPLVPLLMHGHDRHLNESLTSSECESSRKSNYCATAIRGQRGQVSMTGSSLESNQSRQSSSLTARVNRESMKDLGVYIFSAVKPSRRGFQGPDATSIKEERIAGIKRITPKFLSVGTSDSRKHVRAQGLHLLESKTIAPWPSEARCNKHQ
mmetsp:Transcript_86514/g.277730  ORF Transcript_86514/g.277730 Transcript_86514/m.277730 type:complete len:195 (+) Transcript_86514:327-911(+)